MGFDLIVVGLFPKNTFKTLDTVPASFFKRPDHRPPSVLRSTSRWTDGGRVVDGWWSGH